MLCRGIVDTATHSLMWRATEEEEGGGGGGVGGRGVMGKVSIGTESYFGYFRSSEQHADGAV